MLRQPRHAELDGIQIEYVPYLSPPRGKTYGAWGAWAAPSLHVALARLHRRWPFDLVHAHNAVPAGGALRPARGAGPPGGSVPRGGAVFSPPPPRGPTRPPGVGAPRPGRPPP